MARNRQPLTTKALRLARDTLFNWRDTMLQRLVKLNVVMMPQEQHEQLLRMVASEMTDRAIAEARVRTAESRLRFWSTWQGRLAVATGLVSLFIIAVSQIYGLLAGYAHPVKP